MLRDAEINKLMKQADYISLVEQSWVSRLSNFFKSQSMSFCFRYIDLNIETQVTVRPGMSADMRNNFDKKLVSKWQKFLYK